MSKTGSKYIWTPLWSTIAVLTIFNSFGCFILGSRTLSREETCEQLANSSLKSLFIYRKRLFSTLSATSQNRENSPDFCFLRFFMPLWRLSHNPKGKALPLPSNLWQGLSFKIGECCRFLPIWVQLKHTPLDAILALWCAEVMLSLSRILVTSSLFYCTFSSWHPKSETWVTLQ